MRNFLNQFIIVKMKKSLAIVIFFLLFSFCLSAQTSAEKIVANQIELLRQAMIKADEAALNDLVGEKLSYGHSAGYVEDKREFIRKLTSKENGFTKIDLSNQSINMSGDVAIVRHRLDGKSLNAGVAGEVKLLILMVWQKDHGVWKLLARQAVKILP